MPPEVTDKDPVRGALGKKKSRVHQIVDDNTSMERIYRRLFATRDGKVVLADLLIRFYDNALSESDTIRDVGRRDVLHFIKRTLTL